MERLQTFRKHGVHVLGSFIFGLPTDRAGHLRCDLRSGGESRRHLRSIRDAYAVRGNRRFRAVGKGTGANVATIAGIPLTRYWLIPAEQRPKMFMPHPTMGSEEMRARTQAVWDRFYSLPNIWRRSRCTSNFRARLAFLFISKLYRQMYASTGIASDSARRSWANRGRAGSRSPAGAYSRGGRCRDSAFLRPKQPKRGLGAGTFSSGYEPSLIVPAGA